MLVRGPNCRSGFTPGPKDVSALRTHRCEARSLPGHIFWVQSNLPDSVAKAEPEQFAGNRDLDTAAICRIVTREEASDRAGEIWGWSRKWAASFRTGEATGLTAVQDPQADGRSSEAFEAQPRIRGGSRAAPDATTRLPFAPILPKR